MNVQQLAKEITNKVIEKLKQGVIPWKRPWSDIAPPLAMNWSTKNYYTGINQWILEPGQYATFLQIKNAGGKLKKGAKAQSVYFSKPLIIEEENENNEKVEKKIYMFKEFKVFNIEQTDLKPHQFAALRDNEKIEICENVLASYTDCPLIKEVGNKACYVPLLDQVRMPKREAFVNTEKYYSVLFHELIHSTGASHRLDRNLSGSFGTKLYAKEELVAELGAAIICNMCQIDNATIEDHASYINSWLKSLEDDHTLLYEASKLASKAVEHITSNMKIEEVAS